MCQYFIPFHDCIFHIYTPFKKSIPALMGIWGFFPNNLHLLRVYSVPGSTRLSYWPYFTDKEAWRVWRVCPGLRASNLGNWGLNSANFRGNRFTWQNIRKGTYTRQFNEKSPFFPLSPATRFPPQRHLLLSCCGSFQRNIYTPTCMYHNWLTNLSHWF